jgi:hypothetical protein
MGNIISSTDNSASLKTTYDSDKVARDTALNLANGDTTVKQKLIVTGTSTFNDDITLSAGKKINGIDVASLNTNIGTLQTTVAGMNSAVSGDFSNKAISGATSVTVSGAGTFASVKTSNIDINGNITSTTGKSFITADAASGVKMTNGLASSDPLYAYQSISNTGDINIRPSTGKQVSFGSINIVNNSINGIGVLNTTGSITSGGTVTAKSLSSDTGLDITGALSSVSFNGTKVLGPYNITYGNTVLNSSSINVPAVTTASVTNSGALVNTGALKLGTNKWLINEVKDAQGTARLCFGTEVNGTEQYFSCMDKTGDLVKYATTFKA